METLLRDLRHAWRSAVGAPGFTALAALTLALGIGAATVVFALTDAVLLRPFPFAQPERLVAVWGESPDAGHARVEVSVRDAEDWRAGNRVFSELALLAASDGHVSLTGPDGAIPVRFRFVSAGFFDVLGSRPALGRTFLPGDERRATVVISDRLWRERLGGDPAIVGRTLRMDSEPVTVIGVMPPGFRFPYTADAWGLFSPASEEERSLRIFQGLARLRPGVSLQKAQDGMSELSDSASVSPALHATEVEPRQALRGD